MQQLSYEFRKKFTDVLVKFAMNFGKGVQKDDTVCFQLFEHAKDLIEPFYESVFDVGGKPFIVYLPDETDRRTLTDRYYYKHAKSEALEYFPEMMIKSRSTDARHLLAVTENPNILEGIESNKLAERAKALKFYYEYRTEREDRGDFTWTLTSYPSLAKASAVGITLDEYFEEFVKACHLDANDPVATWRDITNKNKDIVEKLNTLEISKVRVLAKDTDLEVVIGEKRKWVTASGKNIPSYEIYTSPDGRYTSGKISVSLPLYFMGQKIDGITLVFKDGEVVEYDAKINKDLLTTMLKIPGGNKIGEFSLTDKRFSRINKYLGETIYIENFGGDYGNTHIALGSSYNNTYAGDIKTISPGELEGLGFNKSAIHTDVVSTTNRQVIATLKDGSEKLIYDNGIFVV